MNIVILPALRDNYMYLLIDNVTKEAAVVDPVEPKTVIKVVEEQGLNLTTVLTTHHHWDHAGGNKELLKLHPGLNVYGGDIRIDALTNRVEDGSFFRIGNLYVKCLFTPGHTSGDICYHITSPAERHASVVFTGDTLFLGGCGTFFEGTADQMYDALVNILSRLPGHTRVFGGHEYSLRNLKFAARVEPENEDVRKKIEWTEMRRLERKPTMPSTIAEEKLYNPFMRVTVPAVMQYANKTNSIETMKVIRQEKDCFVG